MQRAIPKTLLMLLIAALLVPSAKAYDDDFYDYEWLQFVSSGIGPMFFTGEFDEDFRTALFVNVRLGVKLFGPFSLVPTLGGGIVSSETSGANTRSYSDYSLRGQLRLAPLKSFVIPYLEGGIGWIGLDGVDFQYLGGGGIDFRIWGRGTLGAQIFYQQLSRETSASIPLLVVFSYIF